MEHTTTNHKRKNYWSSLIPKPKKQVSLRNEFFWPDTTLTSFKTEMHLHQCLSTSPKTVIQLPNYRFDLVPHFHEFAIADTNMLFEFGKVASLGDLLSSTDFTGYDLNDSKPFTFSNSSIKLQIQHIVFVKKELVEESSSVCQPFYPKSGFYNDKSVAQKYVPIPILFTVELNVQYFKLEKLIDVICWATFFYLTKFFRGLYKIPIDHKHLRKNEFEDLAFTLGKDMTIANIIESNFDLFVANYMNQFRGFKVLALSDGSFFVKTSEWIYDSNIKAPESC